MEYKQLLTVGDNTKAPSSSQIWFHLVNIVVLTLYFGMGSVITYKMLIDVPTSAVLLDSFIWLTAVVSGIITSNKFANKLLEFKLGNKDAKPTDG